MHVANPVAVGADRNSSYPRRQGSSVEVSSKIARQRMRLPRRLRFFRLPIRMKLNHPALVRLLQQAYSAERAAAFAYIGHAGSLREPLAKGAVKQIEDDEWKHREN